MIYSNNAKEIIKNFWDLPKTSGASKALEEYYATNFERLLSNSNNFIDSNSVNVGIFWSELVRSNFIIKFISDFTTIYDQKTEIKDINEGIKIIKNTFENAYRYFGFFTICDINSTSELYDFWYKPNNAESSSDKKAKRYFKIKDAEVSGQYWAINNCALLKFANFDIKLLREIRHAESHEKLVIKEDLIYILDGEKARKLEKREILEIASFLRVCIGFVSHFYISLLLRERFWIFLSIFILRKEKYKNANIPFYILKSIEKSKEPSVKTENIFNKEVAAVSEIVLKFLLFQLWIDLGKETYRTNLRLQKMNLNFDKNKISKLHEETVFDFYHLINLFIYKTKQLFLGHTEEYRELEINKIDNLDFEKLLHDAKRTYVEALRKKEKDAGTWIFLSVVLTSMIGIILPLEKLVKNFKDLVSQMNN